MYRPRLSSRCISCRSVRTCEKVGRSAASADRHAFIVRVYVSGAARDSDGKSGFHRNSVRLRRRRWEAVAAAAVSEAASRHSAHPFGRSHRHVVSLHGPCIRPRAHACVLRASRSREEHAERRTKPVSNHRATEPKQTSPRPCHAEPLPEQARTHTRQQQAHSHKSGCATAVPYVQICLEKLLVVC